MSNNLDIFCFIVLVANTTAVELSTCIGIGGCVEFILMRNVWMVTDSGTFMNIAPILASAADPMIFFLIFSMT